MGADDRDGAAGDDDDDDGASVERAAQIALAIPVSVSMSMNTLRDLVTLVFVGRARATVELAGAALAMTTINIACKSVLVGLASAVNTLAGTAYGLGAYERVGETTQRALLVTTTYAALTCAVFATRGEEFLAATGQDAGVSREAGRFLRAATPGVLCYAWTQCTMTYLHSQGITRPQALGGVLAAIAHPILCYYFVWRWEIGVIGAALAWSASSAVCLATQVAYATVWRRMFRERDEALALKRDMCWPGWQLRRAISTEGLREYFALALPGVAMKMEWWASEMTVVMAGYLPNPEIALSALSIYGSTNAFVFDASIGLGVASLTRVTHELGAGNAKRARRAVAVSFQLIACVGVIASVGIIVARKAWANLFTSREEVRELVSELMIALAAYALFDCAGAVQAGVTRACGKQSLAAKIVVVAYWIIGIPLSLALAFGAHMGALGLVLGGLVATVVHTGALGFVIARRLDWDAEVVSARDRHALSTSHAAEAGYVPRSSSFALLESARANDLTRQYGAAV